jgi:hypothetical protein
VGRLEEIASRNERANTRSRNRVLMVIGVAALVVLSVILSIYSDLGKPPGPDRSHAYGVEMRQMKPRAGSGSAH